MKKFLKNYWFILCMLTGIVGGCLVGAFAPDFGGKIKFLGTLFINMMFCVVVPMVFCSIASAIANMKSVKRAGKIMGVTVATFLVTAAIAGVLMYIVCRIFPLVDGQYTIVEGDVGEALGFGDMIVNFFTKPDFMELLSRKAILPLIVAAVLFGFGVQMNGGPETKTAQLLEDITGCIMKTVKLITYYAPIGFFGFFADLVATYGPELMKDYSRTLIIYYVMSFAYMFIFFPIYARFGGGKGGAKIMFSKLFRPAAMSFGTCSSVATIPTNMEVAEETGISKDVTDIVLPMGATMHMDGSAMSAIIKVAFLFGVFGLDFSTDKAILAIIVAVFSSVAMSGIPGGGGTGELVVCTIFFPDQLAVAYPIALAIGKYDYTGLISDTSKAFIKPNSEYWFGTDNLGRDYWCQVWYATQVSIRLALIVAVGESILGVIIGLIWGYVRKLDRFFTELYNLIDNVPYIIYMTLIALVVGQSFTIMAVSMIAIGWLVMARRVRNMVFMFRDREYNLASRCLGTPLWRVLTKNILPYLVSVIILRMALSIPGTINLESTLSYLGLGLGIDTPSLGLILSKVRGFFLDYPYLLVFPASIVSIISISFYIMGNAFSDAADPRNHV